MTTARAPPGRPRCTSRSAGLDCARLGCCLLAAYQPPLLAEAHHPRERRHTGDLDEHRVATRDVATGLQRDLRAEDANPPRHDPVITDERDDRSPVLVHARGGRRGDTLDLQARVVLTRVGTRDLSQLTFRSLRPGGA